MQTITPWPVGLKREFKPLARLVYPKNFLSRTDLLAMEHAQRVQAQSQAIQCSGTTGTWAEMMWTSQADGSAVASTSSEATLLGGLNDQPTIPALFFFSKQGKYRVVTFEAMGVLSNTGTPTIAFQLRMSTTQGSSTLSGASLALSGAGGSPITTASSVTTKFWNLRVDLLCTATGQGSGNATLQGAGFVQSPGGFASPFVYAMEPTIPDTATWTQTFDGSLTYYLNLSVTWGASSSSNTITCKAPATLKGWN